jgi:hypothetical protein
MQPILFRYYPSIPLEELKDTHEWKALLTITGLQAENGPPNMRQVC